MRRVVHLRGVAALIAHLASAGLWRRRHDIATLLGGARMLPPVAPARGADAFVGWGAKASGQRARRLAGRHGAALHLLEDGFLAGHFGGRATAPVSYILDTQAAHYEGDRASDLESAIRDDKLDTAGRHRARSAMDAIVAARLTKYNDAPLSPLPAPLGPGAGRPYVLLVEQVEGDLSLGSDGAAAFETMLAEAEAACPDHRLVVRPHPAARGEGPLERAAAARPDRTLVLRERCNPWPLLEGAARLYTHSSHLGFEALMAGTPVTVFGRPFYAGWGLTDDRASFPRRAVARDLEAVFHAAYIGASRYLDLHDRSATTLERTIEALTALRDTQARNRSRVLTGGLSPWKRRAVSPFLTSLQAAPRHERTLAGALAKAGDDGSELAVWGAEDIATDVPLVRLEDGFVRSVGLGAALRLPLSLISERRDRLPFDARGPNGIERRLREDPPGPAECERALQLGRRIVEAGITKYMLGAEARSLPATDRPKVLVVGQVETDASIRFGAEAVRTNDALIAAVRTLYPDALIAYRDHPDVASGLRPGRASRTHVDLEVGDHALTDLLEWCDRLETITSLTGFEALLRGRPVGTHGWPFYAGWGLTDDRARRAPRGEASLGALMAATLIRVPAYIHPASRLPCSPERAVEALATPPRRTLAERLLLDPAGLALGRLKHAATGR